VLGIDFGTTYTGVAWTASPVPRSADIHLVKSWEGVQYVNAERGKCPTVISYPVGDGEILWGYNIPVDVKPIQWFKLLLLDEEDWEDHLQDAVQLHEARQALAKLRKPALAVVADYLRCLWAHVLRAVENGCGPGVVRQSPFRIIITVPAIWKSYTRERMRQAASLAGLLDPRGPDREPSDLDFISEPEAAAIATFADFQGGFAARVQVRLQATVGHLTANGYRRKEIQSQLWTQEAVRWYGLSLILVKTGAQLTSPRISLVTA